MSKKEALTLRAANKSDYIRNCCRSFARLSYYTESFIRCHPDLGSTVSFRVEHEADTPVIRILIAIPRLREKRLREWERKEAVRRIEVEDRLNFFSSQT